MSNPVPSRLLGTCLLLLGIVALPGRTLGQCDVTATTGSVVVPGPPVPATAVNTTPHATFQATADFGPLSVDASVFLPENASENGMNAIAQFNDQLTITAPGVPQFTAGTFTAVIDTRGTPEITHTATGPGVAQGISASYQLFVSRNGGAVHLLNGSRAYNSSQVPPESTTGSVPGPGVQQIDIAFLFGVPFTLSGYLLANSGGSNIIPPGSTGTLTGHCGIDFDWNGISSIRDGGGTEYVGVATVVSCSGFDWKGNLAPTAVADLVPTDPTSSLEPGFPNPFRRSTTIAFSVGVAGPVSIELFDAGGRRVRALASGFRPAGRHAVTWDGADSAGRSVPSGVYFVRLVGPHRTDREKIVLRR